MPPVGGNSKFSLNLNSYLRYLRGECLSLLDDAEQVDVGVVDGEVDDDVAGPAADPEALAQFPDNESH